MKLLKQTATRGPIIHCGQACVDVIELGDERGDVCPNRGNVCANRGDVCPNRGDIFRNGSDRFAPALDLDLHPGKNLTESEYLVTQ